MNASASTSGLIALREGALLSLKNAAGTRITVRRGCVWITQEGDPRDIVVRAGEWFLLDRAGLTVVHMLKPGEIFLETTGTCASVDDVRVHLSLKGARAAATLPATSLAPR